MDPHWIGDGNRFWYRRETSDGHEFILVDAGADKQEHLFDHKKVARILSETTGESHSGEALPFKSFHLDPEADVIRFDLDGQGWECSLAGDGCVELDRPLDLPGESRSPDGQWSVFVREHDLFARSEASGDTIRLTDDGERHQAYASPPEDLVAVVGEPGHRWLTAFGPYEGDTAMLEIELTSGGVFDSPTPETMSVQDGSIMLQFSDCNAATLVYDISSPKLQGEFDIQRIATDNVTLCEAATTR